jgi:hypothetical protein
MTINLVVFEFLDKIKSFLELEDSSPAEGEPLILILVEVVGGPVFDADHLQIVLFKDPRVEVFGSHL